MYVQNQDLYVQNQDVYVQNQDMYVQNQGMYVQNQGMYVQNQALYVQNQAFFFFFFFPEILPWANLSVLYKEPVFRSAQHYIFRLFLILYDGEWYEVCLHNILMI